ncbi:hypothetical protein M3Y99_01655700 [Aphelenchoides fujianensis]|nr:hypothetical protein M3Y99_01655700 [Aphelenchoides fujianensis]
MSQPPSFFNRPPFAPTDGSEVDWAHLAQRWASERVAAEQQEFYPPVQPPMPMFPRAQHPPHFRPPPHTQRYGSFFLPPPTSTRASAPADAPAPAHDGRPPPTAPAVCPLPSAGFRSRTAASSLSAGASSAALVAATAALPAAASRQGPRQIRLGFGRRRGGGRSREIDDKEFEFNEMAAVKRLATSVLLAATDRAIDDLVRRSAKRLRSAAKPKVARKTAALAALSSIAADSDESDEE